MKSEEFICTRCGIVTTTPKLEEIPLARGGFHLKASCPECGAYIRFVSHAPANVLYFGQYKGQTVAEVAAFDEDYLAWLFEQPWIKPKLKIAIGDVINGYMAAGKQQA